MINNIDKNDNNVHDKNKSQNKSNNSTTNNDNSNNDDANDNRFISKTHTDLQSGDAYTPHQRRTA